MQDHLLKNDLTFEDGILLCKHIFQCAIHKTLNGVPEEWDIFYKTHETLKSIDKFEQITNNQRLNEVLHKLNIDDIFKKI
ncbi:MAG: hypothetical protein R6V50_06880 [Thermoplasmatota archaeon]